MKRDYDIEEVYGQKPQKGKCKGFKALMIFDFLLSAALYGTLGIYMNDIVGTVGFLMLCAFSLICVWGISEIDMSIALYFRTSSKALAFFAPLIINAAAASCTAMVITGVKFTIIAAVLIIACIAAFFCLTALAARVREDNL